MDEMEKVLLKLKREERKSNEKISKILNISKEKVSELLKKYKITVKEKDYNLLYDLFVNKKYSMTKISKELNCSRTAVKTNLIEFNLMVDDRKETICSYCGKVSKNGKLFKGNLYCKKHYIQMYRHGKILSRTIYDKNDFIQHEDSIEIKLYDKNNNYKDSAYIDKEDFSKIKDYKWYCKNGLAKDNFYCVTKGINPKSAIPIQDVIFDNLDDDYKVIVTYDHIDNDGLNNRKSNLRIVTKQENAMNMSMKNTNTSGVVGIAKYTRDTILKWDSRITYNYKNIYLGRYTSFDNAVKHRLQGEAEYFKEFSPNYNPATNTIQLSYISHDDNLITFIECDLQGNITQFTKIT